MKMGGFMGEITYEGKLKEFWPYIKLGEYMHVGKGSGVGEVYFIREIPMKTATENKALLSS